MFVWRRQQNRKKTALKSRKKKKREKKLPGRYFQKQEKFNKISSPGDIFTDFQKKSYVSLLLIVFEQCFTKKNPLSLAAEMKQWKKAMFDS